MRNSDDTQKRKHGLRTPKNTPKNTPRNTAKPWHHSPSHIFIPNQTYIVTAGTCDKQHFFKEENRLNQMQEVLFEAATDYGWELEAWALFSNHYHFIAHAAEYAKKLRTLIQRFHSQTSRYINRIDNASGRKVWFQYWDTCLTFEKSYYPRLNYVHNNPVKHGLVPLAEQYQFCSAKWFLAKADNSFRKKVESFRYDQIKIEDDF